MARICVRQRISTVRCAGIEQHRAAALKSRMWQQPDSTGRYATLQRGPRPTTHVVTGVQWNTDLETSSSLGDDVLKGHERLNHR